MGHCKKRTSSCRCGSNKTKKTGCKRRYKNVNRCQCIIKYKTCSTLCKCSGQCGGATCKKTVLLTGKKLRSPPKMKHILQTSKIKFQTPSTKLTFPLNFLEMCLLCAVIHSFKISGKQFVAADVHSMYIQVIDSLLEIGIVLPLERRTLHSLYTEITKIEKDFSSD